MSLLQIDAYRNMSRSGISQLALISDGQWTRIGSASDTNVGFLKRLFNTDASKKLNIEVTRDFNAALVRAYDAKVADEAFTSVIGKSGLSAQSLARHSYPGRSAWLTRSTRSGLPPGRIRR